MFIIRSAPCSISRWASANVRALSVSASSWLCSAITPAPQHDARSSSTSSIPSTGATFAIEPCSSGVKPRLTHPGQYATLMRRSGPSWSSSYVGAPLFGQLDAARGSVQRLAGLRRGDAGAARPRVVLLAHDVQVQLDARFAV